jgi:glycine dehydrogenase subunit 1
MSLLGPRGFEEVGSLILQRSHYAASLLDEVPGVRVVWPQGFFKELVVSLEESGVPVAEVNRRLRARRIFGGKDLSLEQPSLGQSALYCVTELHTRDDLERLAATLVEVLA